MTISTVRTHRKSKQLIARSTAAIGLFVLSLFSANAFAERLNVVEMFTSQSCYSCPAADELLAKLAANDKNILNLEFHVDYWNDLQYGKAGSWVDPYSAAEYTRRQQTYAALKLRGNSSVYTPQAVINGIYGNVGSNRRRIEAGLKLDSPRPVNVSVGRQDSDTLSIDVNGYSEVKANVYLVHFLRKTSTRIPSGENHGKIMENFNVVVDMHSLGTVAETSGESLQVAYTAGENRGCAVLVQQASLGAILGAARCP